MSGIHIRPPYPSALAANPNPPQPVIFRQLCANLAGAGLQSVPCHPLDELVPPDQPVSLIKIDVEGHELRVLQGAAGILAHSHPILYVENDRLDQSPPLIQLLLDHGYRLWWHITQAFQPNNFLGQSHNIYGDLSLMNMIALHPVHNSTLQGLPEITHPLQHPLRPAAALTAETDAPQTPAPVDTPCATPH